MTDFLLYLQNFSTPLLDSIFLAVSALTGELVYIAIVGTLYWCVDKNKAYYVGVFLFLSFSLNTMLKNIFQIPRPYTYSEVRQIDTGTGYGYSFPSGHAQMSTTFAGMFSAIFKKRWIYIAGFILVILTGLSRMYLGVHTPVDIFCGITIGLVLTFLGNRFKNIKAPRVFALAVFIFMFIVTIICKDKDVAKLFFFAAGFFAGNLIEERFIGYTIPQKVKPRIIGAVAGFVSTVILIILLKALGLTYLRYLALGFYITIVVPIIIKKLDKK